jgi:hypothetical protein
MKAALALSKIKNEDLKTRETLIEEMRNNLMESKRTLLNEVSKSEVEKSAITKRTLYIFSFYLEKGEK